MKTAMKLTTGILIAAITMAGAATTKAVAQSQDAIDNARSTAKALEQNDAATTSAKPVPGAPAPAIKLALIPGSSAATKPATKPASASSANNQLKHVNVLQGADNVQIEITSSRAVTPKVSKLSSPARVLVELPETVIASSQSKIPVNSAGVKGVRIGMDGKTPPTTSVVVDLETALTYDITPGSDGKVVLTLHTQGGVQEVAKNTPVPAKNAPVKVAAAPAQVAAPPAQAKPAVTTAVAKPADTRTASVKPVAAKAPDAKPAPTKPAAVATSVAKTQTPAAPAKGQPAAKIDSKQQANGAAPAKPTATTLAAALVPPAKPAEPAKPKPEEKHWAMTGKRDPFFSPVVQNQGSGCSTGKKCLEIGAINLRGVVKSDTGFIAVVTNSLNKAYFLRENDPVFNGYVVKITGDSVVFQETIQDKLGKPFTREVVKRIFTPAV